MKKARKKGQNMLCENQETCVVCGAKTEYARSTPIDERQHYVEGVGQLCPRCYYEFCLFWD